MKILLKVASFSLLLLLVFTLFMHILPQMEEQVPVDQPLDLAVMDQAAFIELGEQLFQTKGNCGLCHRPPPMGRAPELVTVDVMQVARRRLADPGYQGKAVDETGYLLESMIDPDRYVVPGWGKGGGDEGSPMPAADKPPVELSRPEVDAIIAYLQAKDGHPVGVALPGTVPPTTAVQPPSASSDKLQMAETGEAVFAKYACAACHKLESDEAGVGPGLGSVGLRLNRQQIRQSIIDPYAEITEGFPPAMPADFADKLTVRELQLLVDLLAEQGR